MDLPRPEGREPNYGDYWFAREDRRNRWLHMVSGVGNKTQVHIHQDAAVYSLELDAGREVDFPVGADRQAYLVQIEGTSNIN